MNLRQEYNYSIISRDDFDIKYLINKKEDNLTKKYILVSYCDEFTTANKKIYSINELKDIKGQIIVKYYTEEIDATTFAGEYSHSKYYHILNIGYIHEFQYEFDNNKESKNTDFNKIKEELETYKATWKSFKIDDYSFLNLED